MIEKTLAQHFNDYFSICIADTVDLKKEVFKLRYDVYCAELGYEKYCPIDCEKDNFDEYSNHVLIKHKPSGIYAGCIRLVKPPSHNPKALLPFEAHCSQSFDQKKVAILCEGKKVKVGELSRLAVRSMFRLRRNEAKSPYGINPERISLEISSDEGRRFFPFIAMALSFAGISMLKHHNIKYGFVMMETSLARLLKRSEINFIQLGETMEYHGQRALFYVESVLIEPLEPQLKEFYKSVDQQLTHD